MENKDLKRQQCAWAVAWQDDGDQVALLALVDSVEALAMRFANRYARNQDQREEYLAQCRLAAIEAAGKFDRGRPDGYVSLCHFTMWEHARTIVYQAMSPASGGAYSSIEPAVRVAIVDDFDESGGVALVAEDVEVFEGQGTSVLQSLIDEAGLTERHLFLLARYKTGQSLEEAGKALGISAARAWQLEGKALEKVRALAESKGLELRDLL